MIYENYPQFDFYYIRGNMRYVKMEFVKFLIDNDLLLETEPGGLLLGPAHLDGGIQVISFDGSECAWFAEFEGWEYIINVFGSASHGQELETINKTHPHSYFKFEEYDIPEGIKLIDCRPVEVNGQMLTKWVITGSAKQWIICRESTKAYLTRLNEINETTWKPPLKE